MLRQDYSAVKFKSKEVQNPPASRLFGPASLPPFSQLTLEQRLLECARLGDVELAHSLLRQRVSIEVTNEEGNSCLQIAVINKKTEFVKFALSVHADVDHADNLGANALVHAFGKSNEILELILDQSPNLEPWIEIIYNNQKRSVTLLMLCAYLNSVSAINVLVAHGARLNIADEFGWTALYWATLENKAAAISVLLQSGADQTLKVANGLTSRQQAIVNKRADIFDLLLKYDENLPSYRLDKTNYKSEVPDEIQCIFTCGIMNDPITVSSGITYDREQLNLYYISLPHNPETFECPQTKFMLEKKELQYKTNITIKDMIEKFVAANEMRCHDVKLFAYSVVQATHNVRAFNRHCKK